MRVLIADGGTGGHIFPAIAVADELRKRPEVNEILFTGTPAGLEGELVPKHGYDVKMIHVGGLIGKSVITRLRTMTQLPSAYLESRRVISSFKPSVAIGFGAYASGPVLLAAHHRKIPFLLVEPNAVPGFTNRLLLRHAAKVAVAYTDTQSLFRGKAVQTGIPVRPLKASPSAEEKFVLGILGGSQGARAINNTAVGSLQQLSALKDRLHIIHQTGKSDYQRIKAKYDAINAGFEVYSFIDDVQGFYNRCTLLVCRAGAITLAEVTLLGKPAVLVPLPTATHNHQEQNARRLEYAGAAKMILQPNFTPEAFYQTVLHFLNNQEELARMAEASKRMGKPDATREIVDLALSLASGL